MAYTERYVTDAGAGANDGTSVANAWSWATMLTSIVGGERANVIGAISRMTTTDVFSNNGTASAPIALRGMNSVLGDLDGLGRTSNSGALITTNFPVITYTTGRLKAPQYFDFSRFVLTSAATAQAFECGDYGTIYGAKVTNTNASGAASRGILSSSDYATISDCDAAAHSSVTTNPAIYIARGVVDHCRIDNESNGSCGIYALNTTGAAANCQIMNAGRGIYAAGNYTSFVNMSFRNITGEVFYHTAGHLNASNCVAWGNNGSDQFYGSAAVRAHRFQKCAVGNMGAVNTNEGDWPNVDSVTLTADPFTSASDLGLNSTAGGGSACKGVGMFGNDIGAIQTPASGGILLPRGNNGGLSQ